MSQYNEFAFLYDTLMNQVPYDSWTDFIIERFRENDSSIELVCELGCGTGNMTMRLDASGYEMIGIDLSENMLMVAREKALESNRAVLFLQQDMTEFELYGTVDAIISTCDSCNYVDNEGLYQVLKLVKNYLNAGGLFIFDLNTRFKFEEIYNNQTFTEVGEDYAYIWENEFDEEQGTNAYLITFFAENEGVYERFEEYHLEYTHELDVLCELLEKAGLTFVKAFDNYTNNEANNESERITIIVKNI